MTHALVRFVKGKAVLKVIPIKWIHEFLNGKLPTSVEKLKKIQSKPLHAKENGDAENFQAVQLYGIGSKIIFSFIIV